MNKNYIINLKLNYDSETSEKQNTVNCIKEKIISVMDSKGFSLAHDNEDHIDYVFSIGGDGTMLHSMHKYINKDSLIIGINAGNVGFLTPYEISSLNDGSIFNFLEPNINSRIERRCILEYEFNGQRFGAVNEYAFTSRHPNYVISFTVDSEIDGIVSKTGLYKANTLLLSTPSGSTAYNMNAGGAIIDPSIRAIQMLMIAPTVLGNRPLIFNERATLHVTFTTEIEVFSDGILTSIIPSGETIHINLMKKDSKILVPDNWNFYSILSKKLHWNNGQSV